MFNVLLMFSDHEHCSSCSTILSFFLLLCGVLCCLCLVFMVLFLLPKAHHVFIAIQLFVVLFVGNTTIIL